MTNNYTASDDYQLSRPCSPFLQGYREPDEGSPDGWVFVEFWCDDKEMIHAFVDHINRKMGLG